LSQDAQDFAGNKGHIFCGVFDGHGPLGREVARHVRDTLPSKLSSYLKPKTEGLSSSSDLDSFDKSGSTSSSDTNDESQLLSTWKNIFVKTFEDVDQELRQHPGIDCICSGTTAVTVVRQVLINTALLQSATYCITCQDISVSFLSGRIPLLVFDKIKCQNAEFKI
jgi:serine/threonine protein phosphatase PrpC